jgi:hypothetical protein
MLLERSAMNQFLELITAAVAAAFPAGGYILVEEVRLDSSPRECCDKTETLFRDFEALCTHITKQVQPLYGLTDNDVGLLIEGKYIQRNGFRYWLKWGHMSSERFAQLLLDPTFPVELTV